MGNVHSTAPFSAQINQINAELSCAFYDPSGAVVQPYLSGNTNLTLSATSPLTGGSGQSIYHSDIAGDFTLNPPTQYVQYNYASWTLDIAATLELTNVSPTNVTIIQSITNPSNSTSFVFPTNGNTVGALGPFALGASGQDHNLLLGEVTANITLYQADGTQVHNGQIQCQKATPQYTISTTAIDDSQGTALAPSNQGASIFPALPCGYKYSLANIPVYCQANGDTQVMPYNLSIGTTIPIVTSSGTNFSLRDVAIYITVPSQVTSKLDSYYGASSSSLILALAANHTGALTDTPGLPVEISNASPGYVDLAGNVTSSADPLASFRYIVPGNRSNAPIPLPLSGTATIGPLIAGQSGSIFTVGSPGIYGTVQGYSSSNGQQLFVGELPVVCDATTRTSLFSIPIY